MCGISAIIGSESPDLEEQLKQSLSKIIHRGSSNFEYKILNGASLGTNRLPITGRSTGQQPVFNEDGTIFAILNGEIFNYKEIREGLILKGHTFKSDTDTEVLVHLYEEYGSEMVSHIDSEMYSFVVFDTKTKDFYVARDRFGVKPLYYAIDARSGNYHFASELKQLSQFDFLKEILDFPPAHYMYNGELNSYYKISVSEEVKDEQTAVTNLTKLIIDAVKKRVDTDLPIAVLLSGGVDSSLIMEIANRFHSDVTGYVLGRPGSSDYEAALKLCKDYKYKYKIVYPDVDYSTEIEQVLYHLELYEAQVIRQSFALDILSRAVARDGYRVALVGDASDEIFGGYNEFVRLSDENINSGCELITNSLARSHNVRLDRMSMKHTLEVRAPFFDTLVVDYAMTITGSLKVSRKDHKTTTKYLIRRIASQFLPDYIAFRYKVPFSNGAGMNVGFNFRTQDGDVAQSILESRFASSSVTDEEKQEIGFVTREEEIYYAMYKDFSYDKLRGHKTRIVTKETLSQIDKDATTMRLIVAEFDRMPVYFPMYLAERLSLFSKRDLDINFIATGGDDLTYNSLFSGSAQIGVSDPAFSFANSFVTKGKIFGSLINRIPVVAIAINPAIVIESKKDFEKYTVGSFQEFSTVHTLAKYYLPNVEIHAFSNKEIIDALKHRKVDVAFVTLDVASSVESLGGRVVYNFEEIFDEYLFTGLTISDNLDPLFTPSIEKFKSALKESLVFISNFPEESAEILQELFPEITNPLSFISKMRNFWHKKLDLISIEETQNAEKVWGTIHPELFKASSPTFVKLGRANEIIHSLSVLKFSREIPYMEDSMVSLLNQAILKNEPLRILSFWGASDKEVMSESDFLLLDKISEIRLLLKDKYDIELEVTFVLSDQHGAMNGYSKDMYSPYLKNIAEQMEQRDVKSIYLSTIWEENGLNEKMVRDTAKKLTDEQWAGIRISDDLVRSAMKRNHENARDGAMLYYTARKLENKILEKKYAHFIQITFSDDKYQEVYPELPTLYLWPYKKGKVDALPWFSN